MDHLRTPAKNPLEGVTFKWDWDNSESAAHMISGLVLALVTNLEVLSNSINPNHRYFNMVAAFSKRATKKFNEWSKQIIKTQNCTEPCEFVMQLFKAIDNAIRKMEEIAVPTDLYNNGSEYDEDWWAKIKLQKDSEVALANRSIVAIATQLQTLQTKCDGILCLPETDDNKRALLSELEKEKNNLLAQPNIHSKVLYEMDVKLIKQLTDFRFGLQNSELNDVLTGIPERDFIVPKTSADHNRKRPIDSISLADAQSSLNFDEDNENN